MSRRRTPWRNASNVLFAMSVSRARSAVKWNSTGLENVARRDTLRPVAKSAVRAGNQEVRST
jgi:hypothetical protein